MAKPEEGAQGLGGVVGPGTSQSFPDSIQWGSIQRLNRQMSIRAAPPLNFEPSLAPHMYVFDKKNEGMNHIPLFDYHSYFFFISFGNC